MGQSPGKQQLNIASIVTWWQRAQQTQQVDENHQAGYGLTASAADLKLATKAACWLQTQRVGCKPSGLAANPASLATKVAGWLQSQRVWTPLQVQKILKVHKNENFLAPILKFLLFRS